MLVACLRIIDTQKHALVNVQTRIVQLCPPLLSVAARARRVACQKLGGGCETKLELCRSYGQQYGGEMFYDDMRRVRRKAKVQGGCDGKVEEASGERPSTVATVRS